MEKDAILIVEDHKDFREVVRHFLEGKNVPGRVVEASSGEEGIMLSHKILPKVVVMDFYLRGINGLEAASKIKERNPNCHIILLTMLDAREVLHSGRNRLIDEYISKSDLYEQLCPAIEKAIKNGHR